MMPLQTEKRKINACPHCLETFRSGGIHVCPAACCYVGQSDEPLEATCPYCENAFNTKAGHVCLELIRLTEPAQ